MIITLIGYRGSGKSSVAPPLAAALGCAWVDADDEIERRAGCSIREIFATGGEPAFRQLEKQVLADLLGADNLVLAAGGGAVLDPQTRARIKAAGPVVWLQASVETLAARLSADDTSTDRRPDLTPEGGRREIERLLAQREPLYRDCADVLVETDDRTVEEIVERILDALPDNADRREPRP